MTEPTTPPAEDAVGVVGWVDGDELADREAWAADMDPADLRDALEAAWDQCVAFMNGRLPILEDGQPAPARLRLAQKLQARALVRAGVTDAGDGQGFSDTVTVFPMDWTVRNLLRPKRGRRGPR